MAAVLAGSAAIHAYPAGARAETPPPWPCGVFGNVTYSEESGDLGGFEVRFSEEGGVVSAEHVFCEGWCNQLYRSPVRRDGESVVFSATEKLFHGDGKVTGHAVTYRLSVAGKGLKLKIWYDGRPVVADAMLDPLPKAFGLEVAEEAMRSD